MIDFDIEASATFEAVWEGEKRYVVGQGSTRSRKTWDFIIAGVMKCLTVPKTVVRVFRAFKADARDATAEDFLQIMDMYFRDVYNESRWKSSALRYVFPNRSLMHFAGCERYSRLQGYKQDYSYIDEAMEVNRRSLIQIGIRTKYQVWLGYNPSFSVHYIFDKIMTEKNKDNYDFVHTTYKDNPFLSKAQIADIEQYEPTPENIARGTADEWHWKVFGKGVVCERPGRVYPRWTKTSFFPERKACMFWAYGMDFGFSDPTTLVLVALSNNRLYLKEIFVRKELVTMNVPNKPTDPSIENLLKENNISKEDEIIGDRSRPETIRAIKNLGYNIRASEGNKILDGINKVRNFHLNIHEDSVNLINEIQNYSKKYDKMRDIFLEEPEDRFNHCLDPVRYVVESIISVDRINVETNRNAAIEDALSMNFAPVII